MQHPWLLLDCIYRLTEVARRELQHQKHIIHFTRKVSKNKISSSDLSVKCEETTEFVRFARGSADPGGRAV
jgi:uncharacterized cysteine cluster protein YcgN (CxxCxxCC family)